MRRDSWSKRKQRSFSHEEKQSALHEDMTTNQSLDWSLTSGCLRGRAGAQRRGRHTNFPTKRIHKLDWKCSCSRVWYNIQVFIRLESNLKLKFTFFFWLSPRSGVQMKEKSSHTAEELRKGSVLLFLSIWYDCRQEIHFPVHYIMFNCDWKDHFILSNEQVNLQQEDCWASQFHTNRQQH